MNINKNNHTMYEIVTSIANSVDSDESSDLSLHCLEILLDHSSALQELTLYLPL